MAYHRPLLVSTCLLFACAPASLTDNGRPLDGFDLKADAAATCTVKQDAAGLATITCPDGTTATVVGEKGDQGEKGEKGDTGSTGTAGSSCSVLDNGNGTRTMTCTNGTAVTWSSSGGDGANPYIPDGVLRGSYTVENSLDAAFLNGVTSVTGDLRIWGSGFLLVALPSLERVGGDLEVHQTDLVGAEFPSLRNPIGGNLTIYKNIHLLSVTLPMLPAIGGGISVGLNNVLENFSLPVTFVGKYAAQMSGPAAIEIYGNENLRSFSIPVTEVHASVRVDGNESLQSFELPLLYVAGDLRIRWNPNLGTISMPLKSVGYRLDVRDDTVLTSLSLPDLASVGSVLVVENNAALCNDVATQLAVQASPPSSAISGNTGICP